MEINKEIGKSDKNIIYFNAGKKIIRGFFKKPFLGKSEGFFFLGKHVDITHGKHIFCGRNVKFEDYSEIQGLCKEGLHFGDNVTIGRGVMIRPTSYYGVGELGEGLWIGDKSSIGLYAYIGCSGKIVIGKNVMFGPKCSLFAENHNFKSSSVSIKDQGVSQKGIMIDDNCWIGSNVVILDGVHIGSGCVIAAGSVITKDVPANSIVIDKRNKLLRERNEE